MFVARKAPSHLAEILRVNECRPKDLKSTVEKEEFPIKARWPDSNTSLESLITVCPSPPQQLTLQYLPKSGKSLKKEPILNSSSPGLTKQCVDLVAAMLTFDPLHRPSCDQLLLHPFFSGVARQPSVESVCLRTGTFSDLQLVNFVEDCGGP